MLDAVDVTFAFAFNRFEEEREIVSRDWIICSKWTCDLTSQNMSTSELGQAV